MHNAFKPPPSAVRCLRHQAVVQSRRPTPIRLLSTSPARLDDIGPFQKQAEAQLLDNLDNKSSAARAGLSPMTQLAEKTKRAGAQSPQRDSDFIERVKRNLFNRPFEEAASVHHLHVLAHKRSTIITLTRPNREVMLSMGCGSIGFRHAKRKGYDPAHQLSSYVLAKIQERGWLAEIKMLELVFRDFGPGREAFTKILMGNEGRNFQSRITRVTDATRLKFGGTRSPQVRRLG